MPKKTKPMPCGCTYPHNPWYHEPLEVGTSYVVQEADEFIGGFGLQLRKTTAPYFARVLELKHGFATARCTDGVNRVLATPQLTYTVTTRCFCGL